jgi:hypothetical protein
MALGDGVDVLGGAIAPIPMAAAALVAFVGALVTMRRCPAEASRDRGVRVLPLAVVALAPARPPSLWTLSRPLER